MKSVAIYFPLAARIGQLGNNTNSSSRPYFSRPYFIGIAIALVAFGVLPLLGCGAAHELETAKVSGRVTLDGEPLPQGLIYVATTKGRMAKALIQEDGTFNLSTYRDGDGVQVGNHPVIITALPTDELSPQQKKVRVKVPKRYAVASTSGLTIDVKAGEKNEVEYALTTEPNG